jgi:hypothetical protein
MPSDTLNLPAGVSRNTGLLGADPSLARRGATKLPDGTESEGERPRRDLVGDWGLERSSAVGYLGPLTPRTPSLRTRAQPRTNNVANCGRFARRSRSTRPNAAGGYGNVAGRFGKNGADRPVPKLRRSRARLASRTAWVPSRGTRRSSTVQKEGGRPRRLRWWGEG